MHIVDGEAIDLEPGAWEHRSVGDVWRRYFDQLRALARSRLVDVLAHPDLVKIFGRRPTPEQARAQYEETVNVLGECEVAVEVSSAGLHRPVGEIYPAPSFSPSAGSTGSPPPRPRTRTSPRTSAGTLTAPSSTCGKRVRDDEALLSR